MRMILSLVIRLTLLCASPLTAGILVGAPGDENWDCDFGIPGLSGRVRSMAIWKNDLYAGGSFTQIGGAPALNVAKWDGTGWSAVGQGLGGTPPNGAVLTLLAVGNLLYAGGSFTNSGSRIVDPLAKWEGSQWTSAGGTTNGAIYALAWDGTREHWKVGRHAMVPVGEWYWRSDIHNWRRGDDIGLQWRGPLLVRSL